MINDQTILLCRSTLKVNQTLLANAPINHVATASSGTDHIDEAYLKTRQINLIDAKGSNATAVADYVIATLAFLMVHKGFEGKKAAIIGAGHVGTKVAQRLKSIDMDVILYDPLKAAHDSDFQSCTLDEVLDCDLISIHANLHNNRPFPSLNLINKDIIEQLKPKSAIINASRGGIVNENDLLNVNYKGFYCTDVYNDEPSINPLIVSLATLCTPHIAGHSIEAKNAAVMTVSKKLHACYQLPPPENTTTQTHKPQIVTINHRWQHHILSLYNPIYETNELKNSTNLTSAFITLRKAHHYRHDF